MHYMVTTTPNLLPNYGKNATIIVENSVVYALSKRRFALQSFYFGTSALSFLQHAFSLGSWRLGSRVPPVLNTGQH